MTIRQIAKLAGVSTTTVSYVINNKGDISPETINRVKKIIEETNFQPNRIAKNLRQGRTNTIGVIVEEIMSFNTPPIIKGISKAVEEKGYHAIFSNLGLSFKLNAEYSNMNEYKDQIDAEIDNMLGNQVDGIIYLSMHDRKIEGLFENARVPVIYIYCYTGNDNDICVTYDNSQISQEATDYLIGHGHKRIALISGPVNSAPSHKRVIGFQTALMEAGLELHADYLKIGNWINESSYKRCIELMKLPNPPTAIFAMDDNMAFGVLSALNEMKISVPDQVSVIGFNNIEACEFSTPRLTSISIPLEAMGYKAIELMNKRLNNQTISENFILLQCKLMERETVAARNEED